MSGRRSYECREHGKAARRGGRPSERHSHCISHRGGRDAPSYENDSPAVRGDALDWIPGRCSSLHWDKNRPATRTPCGSRAAAKTGTGLRVDRGLLVSRRSSVSVAQRLLDATAVRGRTLGRPSSRRPTVLHRLLGRGPWTVGTRPPLGSQQGAGLRSPRPPVGITCRAGFPGDWAFATTGLHRKQCRRAASRRSSSARSV
jgi:hypothetical protein